MPVALSPGREHEDVGPAVQVEELLGAVVQAHVDADPWASGRRRGSGSGHEVELGGVSQVADGLEEVVSPLADEVPTDEEDPCGAGRAPCRPGA